MRLTRRLAAAEKQAEDLTPQGKAPACEVWATDDAEEQYWRDLGYGLWPPDDARGEVLTAAAFEDHVKELRRRYPRVPSDKLIMVIQYTDHWRDNGRRDDAEGT